MGEADLQDDVRELRKQVEALRDVLGKVAEPYREIAGYLDELQTIARGYFRLLDLYAKHGAVSPDLVIPGLKDDISKHIVAALFEKGDRNISQITEAVKGSGERRRDESCGNASKSWRSRVFWCPCKGRGVGPIGSPRKSSRSGHKYSVSPNTGTSLFRDKETRGDTDVGKQGKGTRARAGEREGDLRHFFGEGASPPEQPHGFDLRKGRVREVRDGGRELLHNLEEERDDG